MPDVDPSFAWIDASWGVALTCAPLQAVARHAFTTRHLELTGPGGWDQLGAAVGLPGDRVVRVKQVHGARVLLAPDGAEPLALAANDADALITRNPSVALSVRVADCSPILLADQATGAVAAIHAGWRGTAARIVAAAVDAMRDQFNSRPDDLIAAIGPTIGGCCYDVGPELVDAFAQQGHERYLIDRWFLAPPPRRGERERPKLRLDVAASNRDQLVLAGVPERNVHIAGLCTAMHLDLLTSYRVEQHNAGRLAAVIRAAA